METLSTVALFAGLWGFASFIMFIPWLGISLMALGLVVSIALDH